MWGENSLTWWAPMCIEGTLVNNRFCTSPYRNDRQEVNQGAFAGQPLPRFLCTWGSTRGWIRCSSHESRRKCDQSAQAVHHSRAFEMQWQKHAAYRFSHIRLLLHHHASNSWSLWLVQVMIATGNHLKCFEGYQIRPTIRALAFQILTLQQVDAWKGSTGCQLARATLLMLSI